MSKRQYRTEDELRLLVGCKSNDDLAQRYYSKFGQPAVADQWAVSARIRSLWAARHKLLKRLEEVDRKNNTLLIPAVITKKCDQKATSPFADDDLVVKLHNLIAEQVQLQKESMSVLRDIRHITATQLTLFESKLQKPAQPGVAE